MIALLALQATYVIVDPGSDPDGVTRAWLILPILPVLWIAWAMVRTLRRADEYQRTLQLQAMAVGFGTTLVLALVGGLLDAAGIGDPRQSLQITAIVSTLAWVGMLVVSSQRSR